MDRLNNAEQDTLHSEALGFPHPIINAMIGTNLKYNDTIFLDLRTISQAKSFMQNKNYVLGNDGKEIKVVTRIPKFYTKTRDDITESLNERFMTMSLKSIVSELDKSNPFREYRYTVNLGDIVSKDDSTFYSPYNPTKTRAKYSKVKPNIERYNYTDFCEYIIYIPLFVKTTDIDDLPKNTTNTGEIKFDFASVTDIKLFGLELEFDTVVPQDTLKDNRYESAYIYPRSPFAIYDEKRFTGNDKESRYCVDSEVQDSARWPARSYSIPNVLSGRHCKYQMTFAKSKNRSKTIIHADMIYDSICHTGRTTHKNLGYYDYLKLLRGGNAGSKRFYDVGVGDSGHTYAGAYDENGGFGQYATDYPLPLHVSFVFGDKVPNDYTTYSAGGRRLSDHLYSTVHNYLGCLVIRTYRGISHFIPGNMESFNTKPVLGPISDEPDMFLDSDLWANFLKSFTVKLSIPKKVPSLVFKKDNGDYKFLEVYSLNTPFRTAPHTIHYIGEFPNFINPQAGPDKVGNVMYGSDIDKTFLHAASMSSYHKYDIDGNYIGYILENRNYSTFAKHIISVGGFNGFLLPAERRAMHWGNSTQKGSYNVALSDSLEDGGGWK